MNDAVKKRIEQMIAMANKIKCEADYIEDLTDDIDNDSEDLVPIEMSFDNIERWAREGYDICRNTYDEFEEEEEGKDE